MSNRGLLTRSSDTSAGSGSSRGKRVGKRPFWKKRGFRVGLPRVYNPTTNKVKRLAPLYKVRTISKAGGGFVEDIAPSVASYKSGGSQTESTVSGTFSEFSMADPNRIFSSVSLGRGMGSRAESFIVSELDTGDFTQASGQLSQEDGQQVVFWENPFEKSSMSIASMGNQNIGSGRKLDEEAEEFLDDIGERPNIQAMKKKEEKIEKPILSEDELLALGNKDFEIDLGETNTFFLFNMDDMVVGEFDPTIDRVVAQNERFVEVRKKRQLNPSKYVESGAQTLESVRDRINSNRGTNTRKIEVSSAAVECSEWKMLDEYEERKKIESEKNLDLSTAEGTQTSDNKDNDSDSELDEDEVNEIQLEELIENESEKILNDESGNLHQRLCTLERLIVQEEFFPKQNEYYLFYDIEEDIIEEKIKVKQKIKETQEKEDHEKRMRALEMSEEAGISKDPFLDSSDEETDDELDKVDENYNKDNKKNEGEGEDEDEEPGNQFKSLFEFRCEYTSGQNVNCMTWNKKNYDILAAGYGNIDFVGSKKGYVLCWCVKNPVFPERMYQIPGKGVSSMDFSEEHPNLLSVGFHDGSVNVYDLRSRVNEPILSNKNHNGTVWEMQWVNRGKESEVFHSVGVDGRVNRWSIKKGLDCEEIMRLKQTSSAPSGMISREIGGISLDFHPEDPNIYLVGAEDGSIVKCSVAYDEQYLQTFSAHSGAVYRVRWNPHSPNQFMSCGADWTIRVWNQTKETPLELKIEPYSNLGASEKQTSAITDISWNPHVDKIFGCCSINGLVELWDLNSSTLKPRISRYTQGVQYNCMAFAKNSSSFVVGNNKGTIEILKPQNLFKKPS